MAASSHTLSDRSGNFDIYVKPVTGGNAVQITTSSAQDIEPDWSPDGSSIVFRSDEDAGGLFVISPLGGQERRISRFGTRPRWSPDGTRILFAGAPVLPGSTATADLYTLTLKDPTPTAVLSNYIVKKTDLAEWAWYPDGKSVSVYSVQNSDGAWALSIVPLTVDGGTPRVYIDTAQLGLGEFRWLPDGRTLLAARDVNGISIISKVTIDDANRTLREVNRMTTSETDAVTPSTSADGTRVAFTSRTSSIRPWSYKLATRSGAPSVSREGTILVSDDGSTPHFAVSSDGRRLAYSFTQPGVQRDSLFVRELPSGRQLLFLSDDDQRNFPALSRDGLSVAYQWFRSRPSGYEGRLMVWRHDVGEMVIEAVASPKLVAPCDWTPDGTGIL